MLCTLYDNKSRQVVHLFTRTRLTCWLSAGYSHTYSLSHSRMYLHIRTMYVRTFSFFRIARSLFIPTLEAETGRRLKFRCKSIKSAGGIVSNLHRCNQTKVEAMASLPNELKQLFEWVIRKDPQISFYACVFVCVCVCGCGMAMTRLHMYIYECVYVHMYIYPAYLLVCGTFILYTW